MSNLYHSINLQSDNFKSYSISSGENILQNLSRINIFIGPNNSGKSRFLRALFSSRDIEFTSELVDLAEINSTIDDLHKEIENFYQEQKIASIEGIKYQQIKQIRFIRKHTNLKHDIYDKIENFSIDIIKPMPSYGTNSLQGRASRDFFGLIIPKYLEQLKQLKYYDATLTERKNIYVPTLRGLRNFPNSKNLDCFKERTKQDYFSNLEKIEDNIFTGLHLYEDIKRLLLGPNESRKKIKNFENFLSANFFDRQDFNIIPSIDHDVVNVKIGDDEYPIYHLGEGVQAIIILTYPLFFNQGENLNIFYEEPDQYLHPGFQRIFIETLMRPEFESFQYYFTTHSNHFLDMTLDFSKISIYTFQKKASNYLIENVENAKNNVLELLGIRNSSVFLTNCTIWVEGITDRIYIRKYLELFQKTQKQVFHEDIHYSFVEYGGNNITHWSFLDAADDEHSNINVERLCSKLFLVTDNDNPKSLKNGKDSEKIKRHQHLANKLEDRYYCLQSREIENLLGVESIISVIKELEDNVNLEFLELKKSKYNNEPLGSIIEKKIVGLKKKYSGGSGGIKSSLKLDFAKKAVAYCHSHSDLTKDAQELSERIYRFIQANNK